MDYTLAARWAAVAATLLAVVVALFKEQLQSLFSKPKFDVKTGTRPPFAVKTQSLVYGTDLKGNKRPHWAGSIFWTRLWVQNVGNRRAESVEVFVTKVERLNRDGTLEPVDGLIPSNLRWANTDPEKPEIFYGMNPEMGRFCDFGAVVDPVRYTPPTELGTPRIPATFDLVLQCALPEDAQRLPAGEYQITVKVSAANAMPVERRVKVSMSGNWTEDQLAMFSKELGVSIL